MQRTCFAGIGSKNSAQGHIGVNGCGRCLRIELFEPEAVAHQPNVIESLLICLLRQASLALNTQLNDTYLPYGEQGEAGLANQRVQDNNATRLGVQSCSARVVAKGSALYDNANWDLVDAALKEDFQWAALRDADLPESLRSLSHPQRVERVAQLRKQRESIQTSIQKLADEREEHLQQLRKEQANGGSLDQAFRAALLDQAERKGFNTDGC